jgi:hypothetical protein
MKNISKICVVCGRYLHWRKKWRNTWQEVKYCSEACRKRGVSDRDREIEETIMKLLTTRPATSSICPSEAAREMVKDNHEKKWRHLLEPTRMAARRLAHGGKITITQSGKPVNPAAFRGPIRLKLKR